MYYLFIFLFVIVLMLALSEDYIGKGKGYLYAGIWIMLILVAGFKPVGIDRDSGNYEALFYSLNGKDASITIEYSFSLIGNTLRNMFDDVHVLFLAYAIMSVSLKMTAIHKMSGSLLFLTVAVYMSDYYILHDMTQIRASVASGFMLLCIPALVDGKKGKAFLMIAMATFFHYSAIMLLPLLFINNKPLNKYWKIGLFAVIPIGIVMMLLHIDLLTSIPIPYIQTKVDAYRLMEIYEKFNKVTLVNFLLWIKMAIFIYALIFYDTIYEHCELLPIFLRIMGLSFFFFFAFSTISVFSERSHQMFGLVSVLLFPTIYYTFKPSFIGRVIVCAVAAIQLLMNLFLWDMLIPTA